MGVYSVILERKTTDRQGIVSWNFQETLIENISFIEGLRELREMNAEIARKGKADEQRARLGVLVMVGPIEEVV